MIWLWWLLGGAGAGAGIYYLLRKKPEVPGYQPEFGIITFSRTALESNITDDQNKIINRYSYNKFGNLIETVERYSEERVDSLKNMFKIPILDKTEGDIIFPVFGKITPSEITFKSK